MIIPNTLLAAAMSDKCPYCEKELYVTVDNSGDPHIIGNDDAETEKPDKPLDRGKVLEWIEANFIERPVTFDYNKSAFYPGVRFVKTPELLEAINSGRLDVEEG